MKERVEKVLENALPVGSWLDARPELRTSEDYGSLAIEVAQLEADLTGILGLDDRRFPGGCRIVDSQFREVERAIVLLPEGTVAADVRAYVASLAEAFSAYRRRRTASAPVQVPSREQKGISL
ncbi:hypothetical protein ACWF94_14895 [Streptomyces sp. NPDC055078]